MTPATAAVVTNQVPDSGGVTVILFDRLNTSWGDQAQARRNIVNYLLKVPSTERIGFYVLDSSHVSIVHDFTTDTQSLLRALHAAAGTRVESGEHHRRESADDCVGRRA